MTTTTAPSGPRTATTVPGRRIGVMLLLRLTLFAAFQAVIALVLAATGEETPWAASVAWWPISAVAANVVTLGVLARLLRLEGSSLWSMYRPQRGTVGADLLVTLGAVVLAAPLAYIPNVGLATLFFGDPQVALDIFVQPLPLWAAVTAAVLFPVTTALAELPTYYGYVQPRLARLTGSAWVVVLVPALFLAVQHVTLPLALDPAFIAWRALMFVPFALLVSVLLRWRPRVLPYLVVVHFLLDLSVGLMVLGAS